MKNRGITIYTIGHGRHPFAAFLHLLQKYEIAFLCDVRSVARSRWVQFNGAVFSENLRENGNRIDGCGLAGRDELFCRPHLHSGASGRHFVERLPRRSHGIQ